MRVNLIGTFDVLSQGAARRRMNRSTAILSRFGPDVLDALGKAVPHPAHLGRPSEFAMLVGHII